MILTAENGIFLTKRNNSNLTLRLNKQLIHSEALRTFPLKAEIF